MNTFKIKPFSNPSGATVFRVTGTLDGKSIRKNYPTQAQALTAKQNLEREQINLEPLPTTTTRLTSDQCAQAEAAFRRLEGHPLSLDGAVDFALRNYAATVKTATVQAAFTGFMAGKRASNLRPATLRTLQQRLNQFVTSECSTSNVGDILPDTLRPFIYRDSTSKVNQESDFRAFSNFFNWCKLQGFVASSPLDKLPRIKLDRTEPVILDLGAVRRLMLCTMAHRGGVLVPYVVLALFAAIRPTELARLSWTDIDLEADTVTIGAKIAKMRGRRIVALSDNCAAWLLPHALTRPALVPANWRKDFDAIKRAADIVWTPDLLRHTGISMHLAAHQHEGQTANWAGNSPDIIQRHYKGLVRPADAKDFWTITPGTMAPPLSVIAA